MKMARNSKTQQPPGSFYLDTSFGTNQQIMKPSLSANKVSQFYREYSKIPSSDVQIPTNNSSLMQNFRQNFVNELELNLPKRGSYISQKRISEYFPEVKNVEQYKTCTQGVKNKKRSLEELQMKYDSLQNMVANLSNTTSWVEPVVENELVTKVKRSRSSMQNESKIDYTNSKSQIIPAAPKSQTVVKNIKAEQAIPYTPTFIHLVGYVDNILRWNNILQESKIFVVYNVLGYFMSSMDGIHTKEKFVYIRSNTGIILECSYFEIDRPVPKISKNQFVGCFGHLIGAQRFRLFSIDVLESADSDEIRRVLYFSQRVTHELSNRKFN